jgi:putative flavoprotein involved in K+ transport
MSDASPERFNVIVVGGGQAGLAAAYYLKRRQRSFVILEARERAGEAWRTRWDSCRLFTPSCYNSLPGVPFPMPRKSFPTKDEMADYLDTYAARLELPIRFGTTVERLRRDGDHYMLTARAQQFHAANVIVATGLSPSVPRFASELNPEIRQLHSSEYRRPSQLLDGDVLVVGAGNSGVDIALDLAPARRTWVSGRDVGSIPVPSRHLYWYWWLAHHRIIVGTRVGRWRRAIRHRGTRQGGATHQGSGTQLVRFRYSDLAAAGVERVPATQGTLDGLPVLEDGRVLPVANVVWCTGFRPGYHHWIHLPVFAADGLPIQDRGVVAGAPGLYFVGLPFQRDVTSELIVDMDKHTPYIIEHLIRRPGSGLSSQASKAAVGSEFLSPGGA